MRDRKAVLLLLMCSSTWLRCLILNSLIILLLACCALINTYLASLLVLTAVLSCWATLQISKHAEERRIPLDLPIHWTAKLFDIERILRAVNQEPAPPSEHKKCIEEEYFDNYLPVPWIVETIGGSSGHFKNILNI